MSDLIERISFIVPVISICFITLITSINLYKKIRQNFPIRVNCWFCNVNTKVPYNQYNSWMCSNCDQYNGFDNDGDYNCDIPAQRSIQLNNRWKTGVGLTDERRSYTANLSPTRNGLCETCNRNQEIKMQQLASFEPIVKENYDTEIEHFREKLEKSYALCYSCQRVLKRTLNRVMNNVLGSKLAQIGAKGLQVLDRHVKVADTKTRTILNRMILATLFVLSVWNFYNTTGTINLFKKQLDAYFPPFVTHMILLAISYIAAIKMLLMEYLPTINLFAVDFKWLTYCSSITNDISDFFKTTTVVFNETDFVINCAAVLLSLSLVLENGVKRHGSIFVMLLWNVNMLWPKISEGMVNSIAADILKIFIAILLPMVTIINSLLHQEVPPNGQSANSSFHRIYSNCDEDLSENSDGETTSYSASYNSTPRSRKCDSFTVLNNSFNSVKSLSPSLLSAARTNSASVLNHSFRSEFQHSPYYNQSSQDLFKQHNAADRMYFFPNKPIHETKRCSSMIGLNSSFRIPDDCQNKLIDLNISGTNRTNNRTITCSSPTPSIISLKQRRSQLLTPARLNFNSNSSLTAPVTQTSWVAGGFFVKNNMSPQKRQQTQTDLLHPILSRTSSQSSGFESQASSAHNGNTNGSRESSIAGDIASNFSEPTHFADSASQMGLGSSANSTFTSTLPRPKPFFPVLSKTQSTFIGTPSCRNESLTNYSMFPWSNHTIDNPPTSPQLLPQPVYHQFGTHRGVGSRSVYNSGSVGSLNVFNKFPYQNNTIRKGSLIKPLNDSYFLDDK